jgi:MerR family copper efflux transcriptional regulator
MRIGELAQRSELSTSRIRFYETHGLLPKAERRDNGYRDYPDSAVEILRLIHGAQNLGFSLSEVRVGLTQAGPSGLSKDDMLKALRHKLASLDQHIDEATLRRRRIVDLIGKLESERRRPKTSRRPFSARL